MDCRLSWSELNRVCHMCNLLIKNKQLRNWLDRSQIWALIMSRCCLSVEKERRLYSYYNQIGLATKHSTYAYRYSEIGLILHLEI